MVKREVNKIETRHGTLSFPNFAPDATRAGVRGATE